MRYRNHTKAGTSGLVIGFLLIVVGFVWLLENLGIIQVRVGEILLPSLAIILGVVLITKPFLKES